MGYRITFEGHKLDVSKIDQQHLSNIVHYSRFVDLKPADAEVYAELKKRFNDVVLPYRPLLRFKAEIETLRERMMLSADPKCDRRIIVNYPDTSLPVGEIICDTAEQRDETLRGYVSVKKDGGGNIHTVTTEEIRKSYQDNVMMRPTLKVLFPAAVAEIEEEIRERESKPYFYLGMLLRRKNHPNNVYTVQLDKHNNKIGVYNITHGTWWESGVDKHKIYSFSISCPKRYVTLKEFKEICGPHNYENFEDFTEANRYINGWRG